MSGPELFLLGFGAVLALIGIVVFFLLAWFKRAGGGRNEIQLGPVKFSLSNASLVIFVAGVVLMALPFVLPSASGTKTLVVVSTPTVPLVVSAPTVAPVAAAPAATATPTLVPTARPTPSPLAPDTLLRKLPGKATNFYFLDIKTIQNVPGLESFADEFVLAIIAEAGEILGPALFDSIHSIIGYLDSSFAVISGDFQELWGPIVQAALAQAASKTEKYQGVNIFEFSIEGETSFQAFPNATTWVVTSSKDQAKAVIDQGLGGDRGDPAIAEALGKLGPGYILLAGEPSDLDDPADPNESTDLEGLTLVAVGFSAKDTSTSTAQYYLRFANISQAIAGAAWMRDPESFQEELFKDFGNVNVQVRRNQHEVVAQFEVPNDKLAKSFLQP